MTGPERVVVVGAGLAGSLAAILLSRRGYHVEVLERRTDQRAARPGGGASINLTLAARGLAALDEVGLGARVRAAGTPATGRVVHRADGSLHALPYGERGEALLSIKRHTLNAMLIAHAEQGFGVRFTFGHRCVGLSPGGSELRFEAGRPRRLVRRRPDRVLAADGAFSVVRQRLQQRSGFDYSQTYSSLAYSQIDVAAADRGWPATRDALHVWPRGESMLLAIPNRDGTFTATLLLPARGPGSHAELSSDEHVEQLFRTRFPDALAHTPQLVRDYRAHRPVQMVTIRCRPWRWPPRVLLIGDAAHAIYPSYGQGANAALEDCVVLDRCLADHGGDWDAASADFEERRRRQTDVIAGLSQAHLDALRMDLGTEDFLDRHRLERRMSQLFPAYRPLHGAISFTTVPYADAVEADARWQPVVARLLQVPAVRRHPEGRASERAIREAVAAAGLAPESAYGALTTATAAG